MNPRRDLRDLAGADLKIISDNADRRRVRLGGEARVADQVDRISKARKSAATNPRSTSQRSPDAAQRDMGSDAEPWKDRRIRRRYRGARLGQITSRPSPSFKAAKHKYRAVVASETPPPLDARGRDDGREAEKRAFRVRDSRPARASSS